MEKKRIYPENTPPGNIPYNVVNPAFRYRAIVPADDSIIMEVDHNGVLYISAANNTPTVETPVVSVDGRTVTVTCDTDGAEIFYTTDGSMPTTSSTLYTSPVTVKVSTNFRFVAVKNGMVNSDEATAAVEYLIAPIINFDETTGEVSIENPNADGGTIYYTTDGTTPTDNSTEYTDPIVLSSTTTVKAIITDGVGSSFVSSETYSKATQPTISEPVQDYNTGLYSIEISSEIGTTILYTTDGSTPTPSSEEYSGPIIKSLFTGKISIKAIAVGKGLITSDVASFVYGESSVDAPSIEVGVDGMVTIELQGNTADIPLQTTASNPTIGARIYYTTDGSTPTAQTGTLYTEPFAKPAGNNIVKAITVCYGEYASGVSVEKNVLRFIAQEDNSSISLTSNMDTAPSLEVSRDGVNYTSWTHTGGIFETQNLLKTGDEIYVRGTNNRMATSNSIVSSFIMTGKIAAIGSIMSLLDGTGDGKEIQQTYCFSKLFQGCTSLTTAPDLPATTLANYCYSSMFRDCTGLQNDTPIIYAETMADNCLFLMFDGARNIKRLEVHITNWDTTKATNWVNLVLPGGVFKKPSGTTIPTGTNGIPSGWTVENI